jgi:hypothetical protein
MIPASAGGASRSESESEQGDQWRAIDAKRDDLSLVRVKVA